MDYSSFRGTFVENTPAGSSSNSLSQDQISIDKLSDGVSDQLKFDGGSVTNNMNHVSRRRPLEGYNVDNCHDDEEEEEEEDDFSDEELLAQMGYAKSSPETDTMKEPQKRCTNDTEEEEGDDDDLPGDLTLDRMDHLNKETPKDEASSTPMAVLDLVSALKGGHAKEGKLAKECRVSWAPDVYDPLPKPPEDFATEEVERCKNEKKVKRGGAGKNPQKKGGKSSGASDGKGKGIGKDKGGKWVDKKQAKKRGGNTSRYSVFDEH